MTAERAGYTVTMFVVDVTPTMGDFYIGSDPNEPQMTKLQWVMRFVKHKIQEMVGHPLDTAFHLMLSRSSMDERPINVASSCLGPMVRNTSLLLDCAYRSLDTDNRVNRKDGGYTNVTEYIPIGHPNAQTLEKLDAVEASGSHGDGMGLHILVSAR